MDMFDEEVVLCASSAYEKKFYLNEEFSRLPEDIKNELFKALENNEKLLKLMYKFYLSVK